MCVQPISVKVVPKEFKDLKGHNEHYELVPCGKCPECRNLRRLQWTFRLEQESLVHSNSYFITLTYNNYYLPYDGQLYKPDFQDFIKRFRTYLCRKYFQGSWKTFPSLKYFACGEYGDTRGRCHFHALVFCDYSFTADDVRNCWLYGYITLAPFTSARAAYVVKYSQKQLFCDYPDGSVPPCSLCSNGLGLSWLTPGIRKLYRMTKQTFCYTLNNQMIPLPKTIYQKLFTPFERRLIRFQKDQERLNKERQRFIDFGVYSQLGSKDKFYQVWNNSLNNLQSKIIPDFHYEENNETVLYRDEAQIRFGLFKTSNH